MKVIKKAVKKIVVKKQYSIPIVRFFPNFTYFLSAFNFENFVNSGKIKEFDMMPNGACIRKLPYANPDAAPSKLEAKNISTYTLIWPSPEETHAGRIRSRILFSSLIKESKLDLNLSKPILFIAQT